MTDTIRREMEAQSRSLLEQFGSRREGRVRRQLRFLKLHAVTQPVTAALYAVMLATGVASVAVAVVAWPLWGAENSGHGAVVLAAASAVAFGSIVFSAVTAAFGRAGDLAPGYTSVVLAQRSPWTSGMVLILLSGALFIFALHHPTTSGASAASLLAVSAVAGSWISARRALADSDPLALAQQAGRHYRRSVLRVAAHAREGIKRAMPREVQKDPEALRILSRQHERDLVAGVLRQIRSGAVRCLERGQVVEATTLVDAVGGAFCEYASDVDGEIGPHNGLLEIVLGTFDAAIERAVESTENEVGNYLIDRLVDVGTQRYDHADYAAVRSLVPMRLSRYLDAAWDNDLTTVASSVVVGYGTLVSRWSDVGAVRDAISAMDNLSQVATRAILSDRKHIGLAATGQLARVFPELSSSAQAFRREALLEAWLKAATGPAGLGIAEPLAGIASTAHALVPGITLGGTPMLQQTMWQTPKPAIPDAAGALVALGARLLPVYRKVDEPARGLVADLLALAYGAVLLTGAHCADDPAFEGGPAPEAAAELAVSVLMDSQLDHPLDDGDLLELVWSILVASAFAARDRTVLASAAEEICARLLPLEDGWEPVSWEAGYVVAFLRGLMTAAEKSPEEIAEVEAEVSSRMASASEPWARLGILDWGDHLDPLGRVPSLNLNRVHAPYGLVSAVERWAVSAWPRFVETSVRD